MEESEVAAGGLVNLGYAYGAQNNGQIQKVTYYTAPGVEDTTKTQNYEYDAWARDGWPTPPGRNGS